MVKYFRKRKKYFKYAIIFLILHIVHFSIFVFSFKTLSKYLGNYMGDESNYNDCYSDSIKFVANAVRISSRKSIIKPKCLAKAITAKIALKFFNIPSTLYLGVKVEKGIKAHAWVNCGEVGVVGYESCADYKVISYFT